MSIIFGGATVSGIAAAPSMRLGFRLVLPVVAAAEARFLTLFCIFGDSPVAAFVFPAAWALFMGTTGVAWSTWIAETYRDHAEAASGLWVASLQAAKMLGALLGGSLIDQFGVPAPLIAAILMLLVGAVYVGIIMFCSRPREAAELSTAHRTSA